ncbi:MAG: hypothetical protein KAS67_06820, partial [Thermoplasmata archaeon]|nr:hypothetical protein [Thermoplasmata archaeon]
GSNTWLYLILILVVVGAIAGLVMMKGKGKPAAVDEPEAEAPVEETPEEIHEEAALDEEISEPEPEPIDEAGEPDAEEIDDPAANLILDE